MIRHTTQNATAALALLLAAARSAPALINPNFTPLQVEKQSRVICAVKIAAIAADGRSAKLELVESIKGESNVKEYRVDFTAVPDTPEDKKKAEDGIAIFRKAGASPVFLAIGGGADGTEGALLHADSAWFRLSATKEAAVFAFQAVDSSLNGTFNGGTDMLLQTMRFIRDLPGVNIMPVSPGIDWTSHTKIAVASGTAEAIVAVDVNGDDRLDLFVASPRGDTLLLNEAPDKWSECAGLKSASAAGEWADFDGDGRPDLASLSSAGLKIHLQAERGRFAPHDVKLPFPPRSESLTLAVVDLGDGKASLVAGIGQPVVLRNTGDGRAFSLVPLPDARPVVAQGAAGPCVAADLDGDGLADVLQIYERNGTFWRGKPGGAFEVLPACGALMGKVRQRRASVADLDGDGLSDILLAGGDATPMLLQNRGGGRFDETMRQSGEPGYIIQPGARFAAIGDCNSDTFPDLFVGYEEETGQFFFNRGFRSFAIAETLKFREEDVAGFDKGQAASCWADLAGDGALELITVLASGDVYLSHSSIGALDEPHRIVARLARGSGLAAPVLVTLRMNDRCLASCLADRWRGPAVMAVPEPGSYTVEWRTPDGRKHSKTMNASSGKTEVVIE